MIFYKFKVNLNPYEKEILKDNQKVFSDLSSNN